ncbi:MAG TPA: MBL fold metallo-hydrolase [Chloroflexota bacterium]|nr:MBL fold metallo-hydrolase [Chloroflexota bacterium]
MARLRYLGISFVEIITDDGKVVYIDPCISINPDCPITLNDIEHADLVLVTHMAKDHSSDFIPLVKRTGAQLVCARDTARAAVSAGISEDRIRVVVSGVAVERAGVRVKVLKTEHGSWWTEGDHPVFDLSLGYIVYAGDGKGVYHVGDTSIFGDFALFGRLYRPKVMLTPIGMFPGAITEMDPWEAAIATGMVAPEIAIPIHYDRKTQEEYPRHFANHLATESPRTVVKALAPGETIEI